MFIIKKNILFTSNKSLISLKLYVMIFYKEYTLGYILISFKNLTIAYYSYAIDQINKYKDFCYICVCSYTIAQRII